jgi:hypothetical protein
MGELRYSSTFLDLGTSWSSVVSFAPRLLYPRGKSPRYPLDRSGWASESVYMCALMMMMMMMIIIIIIIMEARGSVVG